MDKVDERKARISKLNIMDDTLFHKIVEDRETCEEVLQVLMQNKSLKLVSSRAQFSLRNAGSKSSVLDAVCMDEDRRYYNIEVQKADRDDYQRRMRYNSSNLDTYFTEKGIQYAELPDVYLFLISNFDLFRSGKTVYHVDRKIRETGMLVNNGVYEIYINTKVDDGSEIAELMKYFADSSGRHPLFPKLSNRVMYFKEEQEGVDEMSSVVEEYARECAEKRERQIIEEFLRTDVSLEIIAKATGHPVEKIREIKEELFACVS